MSKLARKSAKGANRIGVVRDIGSEIIEALEEAIAFEAGEGTRAVFKTAPISARRAKVTPAPEFTPREIVKIRESLGFSQALFAQALNVSPETEKGWEQGKAPPNGASKRLLEIAKNHPAIILEGVVQIDSSRKPAKPQKRHANLRAAKRRPGTARRSASLRK